MSKQTLNEALDALQLTPLNEFAGTGSPAGAAMDQRPDMSGFRGSGAKFNFEPRDDAGTEWPYEDDGYMQYGQSMGNKGRDRGSRPGDDLSGGPPTSRFQNTWDGAQEDVEEGADFDELERHGRGRNVWRDTPDGEEWTKLNNESVWHQMEEGWKQWAAGAAMAGALMGVPGKANKLSNALDYQNNGQLDKDVKAMEQYINAKKTGKVTPALKKAAFEASKRYQDYKAAFKDSNVKEGMGSPGRVGPFAPMDGPSMSSGRDAGPVEDENGDPITPKFLPNPSKSMLGPGDMRGGAHPGATGGWANAPYRKEDENDPEKNPMKLREFFDPSPIPSEATENPDPLNGHDQSDEDLEGPEMELGGEIDDDGPQIDEPFAKKLSGLSKSGMDVSIEPSNDDGFSGRMGGHSLNVLPPSPPSDLHGPSSGGDMVGKSSAWDVLQKVVDALGKNDLGAL